MAVCHWWKKAPDLTLALPASLCCWWPLTICWSPIRWCSVWSYMVLDADVHLYASPLHLWWPHRGVAVSPFILLAVWLPASSLAGYHLIWSTSIRTPTLSSNFCSFLKMEPWWTWRSSTLPKGWREVGEVDKEHNIFFFCGKLHYSTCSPFRSVLLHHASRHQKSMVRIGCQEICTFAHN